MEELKKYPLDYEKLQPGQLIPDSEIELIKGVSAKSPRFHWARLSVVDMIRRHSGLTARARAGIGVQIETELGASKYTATRVKRGVRSIRQFARLHAKVNTDGFTASERQEHDQETILITRICAAQNAAIRGTIKQISKPVDLRKIC